MELRHWIRKLEHGSRKDMEGFELRDGTYYYYDRLEVSKELYLHAVDTYAGRGDRWSEPPEIYQKLCEAKDPTEALAWLEGQLAPEKPEYSFVRPADLYDTHALICERRLVPIHHAPSEDLSG